MPLLPTQAYTDTISLSTQPHHGLGVPHGP